MAEGNFVEGSGHPRRRSRPKKEDKAKKVSRTLSYLFLRNGLSEKGIPIQEDGYVNVDDILDVFSDFIGEDIFKASESADFLQFRQCPQTGAQQIKMVDTLDAQGGAVSLKQPPMIDSYTNAAQHKPQSATEHDTIISKYLSWLLRHGAKAEGFVLQPGGFLYVDEILRMPKMKGYSVAEIQTLVDTNDKQRYHLEPHPQNGHLRIKANRGHSMQIVGTVDAEVGAVSLKQPHVIDSYAKGAQHRPQSATKHDTRLSKYLSWLLRHGAKAEGFVLQPGGFLYVDEILRMPKMKGYSLADIQTLVDTNDKQRFHLEPHPQNGRLQIRANQGHSMQVVDLQLQRITSPTDYPIVLHGTTQHSWQSIKIQGLSRMGRTHIHFAPGEPGESGVISGMRRSCEILIFIDLPKALRGGLDFFVSANNVILSPGDENGIIDKKYFACVFQRSPRIPLKF